jgi:hypothetical protein
MPNNIAANKKNEPPDESVSKLLPSLFAKAGDTARERQHATNG